MRRLALTAAALTLMACVHTLRLENSGTREEPAGEEIISDAGNLILVLSQTRTDLVLSFQREVHVQQDMRIIHEADQVYVPWSPYALTQLFLVSWNPVLWTFPRLYTEAEGRAHSAFHDWLLLWNPFIRAGGRYEEQRRRIAVRESFERRDGGAERLPLNQMNVSFTIDAGTDHESLIRVTDNTGRIRVPFSVLPPAMRTGRPITVEAQTPRGTVRSQLF